MPEFYHIDDIVLNEQSKAESKLQQVVAKRRSEIESTVSQQEVEQAIRTLQIKGFLSVDEHATTTPAVPIFSSVDDSLQVEQTSQDPKVIKPSFSAHTTHVAKYVDKNAKARTIIFKENKEKPEDSINEAAFSELARLFMGKGFTPPVHIVRSELGSVVGVASDSVALSILAREKDKRDHFVNLTSGIDEDGSYIIEHLSDGVDDDSVPYVFLDDPKLPDHFMVHVFDKMDKGLCSVNMESLASVLATSYSLEEDDLHKGNIGVYATAIYDDKGPVYLDSKGRRCRSDAKGAQLKVHYTFFKIDHDLMLANSIRSFQDPRLTSLYYSENSFDITARDIIHFPDINDSKPHYWVTRDHEIQRCLIKVLRYFKIIKNTEAKIYTSSEAYAFKKVKDNPEFIKAKWKHFYKQMLIPDDLMRNALYRHLDDKDPEDQVRAGIITQSLSSRMAKLRTELISIPEFRKYIREMTDKDFESITTELKQYMSDIGLDELTQLSIITEIVNQHLHFANLSIESINNNNNIKEICPTDTPLHIAIKTGDFRYDESIRVHKKYLNRKSQELTPLELALMLAEKKSSRFNRERHKLSNDYLCIAKTLIANGAKVSPKAKKLLHSQGIYLGSKKEVVSIEQGCSIDKLLTPYAGEIKSQELLIALIDSVTLDNERSRHQKTVITLKLIQKFLHDNKVQHKDKSLEVITLSLKAAMLNVSHDAASKSLIDGVLKHVNKIKQQDEFNDGFNKLVTKYEKPLDFKDYYYESHYYHEVKTFDNLRNTIRDIGFDDRLTLLCKKKLTLSVINHYIDHQEKYLTRLKESNSPEFTLNLASYQSNLECLKQDFNTPWIDAIKLDGYITKYAQFQQSALDELLQTRNGFMLIDSSSKHGLRQEYASNSQLLLHALDNKLKNKPLTSQRKLALIKYHMKAQQKLYSKYRKQAKALGESELDLKLQPEVKHFLHLKDAIDDLEHNKHKARPEFRFVRLMRSRFWFIRKILGQFGNTTTSKSINKSIDESIKRTSKLHKIDKGAWCGFFDKQDKPSNQDLNIDPGSLNPTK
jgi:hypothetical protein